MTFLEAQQQARQAFAITSAPGLDTVAKVLQFAVTSEQDRLAAEIAKVEGQNNDLQRALAAERERGDRLAEALEDAKLQIQYLDDPYQRHATSETVLARIDTALAAHQQARP